MHNLVLVYKLEHVSAYSGFMVTCCSGLFAKKYTAVCA